MDPENPPRRVRPETEPKTIDLTANRPEGDAAPKPSATTAPDPSIEPAPKPDAKPDSKPEPSVLSGATPAPDAATSSPSNKPEPVGRKTSAPAGAVPGASKAAEPLPKGTKTTTGPQAAKSAPGETPSTADSDGARAAAAAAAFAEEPVSAAARSATRSSSIPPTGRAPLGAGSAGASGTTTSASPVAPAGRPSRSGALAAGILGGIIALAGAGVLQYAGFVPSIGPGSAAQSSGSGRDFGGEIDALKAELQSRASAPVDTAPLEQRIATLEQTIGAAGTGGNEGLDQLKAEVEQLKSTLADQRQATETTTSALSSRLGEAEKKLEEPSSDVKLARAVAVTALKTAIDKGGPFLAELDALKSISPEDPAVAGLADAASRGVASRADLTRDFPGVADQMLVAIRGSDPNQSVFARLYDSAASAVRVRPVGNVEGNGPEAIVARIEDRLTNGDLKGASLEWGGLPQVAQEAGKDFKTRLDERLRVEGLIDAAVAGGATTKQG